MLVRTKNLQMTIEELDTLLSKKTEDGVVNTMPEVFDYIKNGGSTSNIITDEDINNICV